MTFLEAALEILKREGRPLHFKDLTERAMTKKLLTFVGRTPEVTMQTQLTAAVKKAPGSPFVRVKPGVFGLLRYPEVPPEEKEAAAEPRPKAKEARDKEKEAKEKDGRETKDKDDGRRGGRSERRTGEAEGAEGEGRGRRRRRRGSRGRGRTDEARGDGTAADKPAGGGGGNGDPGDRDLADASDEPPAGGLSPEARAAALAETGVLEGDDDMVAADEDADDDAEIGSLPANGRRGTGGDDGDGDPALGRGRGGDDGARGSSTDPAGGGAGDEDGDEGPLDRGEAFASDEAGAGPGDDGDEGDDAESADAGSSAEGGDIDESTGRRRRRRRRRRRGGGPGEARGDLAPGEEGPGATAGELGAASPLPLEGNADQEGGSGPGEQAGSGEQSGSAEAQTVRRIMAPIDAAIEILRGQPPGRGVHVRQIADTAVRRRLVHGEPNEAWRVIRTALAAESKDRLRSGLRPRVRSAGSGLFALARRPPDGELERAEQVFGEARRALRERTMAALERRIAELPAGAFEALARVLLQREGFGPTTFVKRVEGTIYVEALRGRGSRPSRCLIALRPSGTAAGRRTIGELRAGIRARGQDEGLLLLAGRLAEDSISEWKQPGPPLEIADGAALAETCIRHGVGVQTANLPIDFVDADFFSELAEG